MTRRELYREIGENIGDLLEEYGMTQFELAEAIGVSKQTISAYRQGSRQPSIENLVNIAYVLECDISDLITCDEMIDLEGE